MAHFEPDKVTICGEGVFPRLMFDLPLNTEDTRHAELVREAKQNLEKEKEKLSAEDTAFRDIVDVGDVDHVDDNNKRSVQMFLWLAQRSLLEHRSNYRTDYWIVSLNDRVRLLDRVFHLLPSYEPLCM